MENTIESIKAKIVLLSLMRDEVKERVGLIPNFRGQRRFPLPYCFARFNIEMTCIMHSSKRLKSWKTSWKTWKIRWIEKNPNENLKQNKNKKKSRRIILLEVIMASSQYALILKSLESFFRCPLAPDANNACLIDLKEKGFQIQIEEDKYGNLIIATRLSEVPASRFRENVFKEALKSNRISPTSGIFGYSKKSSRMMIFITVNQRAITKEKLEALLPPFMEKAKVWSDALKNGVLPVAEESGKSSKPSLFGMIH